MRQRPSLPISWRACGAALACDRDSLLTKSLSCPSSLSAVYIPSRNRWPTLTPPVACCRVHFHEVRGRSHLDTNPLALQSICFRRTPSSRHPELCPRAPPLTPGWQIREAQTLRRWCIRTKSDIDGGIRVLCTEVELPIRAPPDWETIPRPGLTHMTGRLLYPCSTRAGRYNSYPHSNNQLAA